MTRIILVTGSGGVGKTTVAAATGLAASRRGTRTLVLSFDQTRGLRDALGQDAHLDIQTLDVHAELARGWNEGRGDIATLLGGGLEGVTAEEVALAPGLDELLALLLLEEHVRSGRYALIIVDGPSFGAALRFVSGPASLGWYVRRWAGPERSVRWARGNVEALARVRDRLGALEALLRDPEVTTLRLVTAPRAGAVEEVRRAYSAFCLQGLCVDGLVVNHLGSAPAEDLARTLQAQVEPLQVVEVPRQSAEVVGPEALMAFARLLHADGDPTGARVASPALGIRKDAVDVYCLELHLPFATRDEVHLSRREAELVIQVGDFRRNVLLPRMVAALATTGARLEGNRLMVSFQPERKDT
ncbi:ArsA family ATPase [Myxococcaceae bacterium JPH2]|nr:ArsA family ATPase [Myxococcaceae bacterium JPH2]